MSFPQRLVSHRPLPPYSYVSGHFPHPLRDPDGHSFEAIETECLPIDESTWRKNEPYLWGFDLFNAGYYWEAHESWEAVWIAAGRKGATADFLKALIKFAAAGVKAKEGRTDGVQRHLKRGLQLLGQTIEQHPERFYLGVDIKQLHHDFTTALESVDDWTGQASNQLTVFLPTLAIVTDHIVDFARNKWDSKYADPEKVSSKPSQVLLALAKWLPEQGEALDIAGGAGRNAIWLAQQGLDVTITDISQAGLKLALARANEAGVKLQTIKADVEGGELPDRTFDLILIQLFLWRNLYYDSFDLLKPGGRLMVIQPTQENLTRHTKPPPAFLLQPGGLKEALHPDFAIRYYREDWAEDGRHDAVVVAEKAGDV